MKWIDIKKETPKYGVYIVHLKNGVVTEMNYSDIAGHEHWFKSGIAPMAPDNPVTHWMERPSPPSRCKGGEK